MSERELSNEVKNLIAQDEVRPVLFIQAEFPSGTRRIWTGVGTHEFRGSTYEGVGGVVAIDTLSESTDSGAQGINISLSGLDSETISDILNDDFQGRPVYIWLGFYSDDYSTIYETDNPIWQGVMDTDEIEDDPQNPTLSISVEHRLVDILRRREVRYTRRDQEYLLRPNLDGSAKIIAGTRWFHSDAPHATPYEGNNLSSLGTSMSFASGGAIDGYTLFSNQGLYHADHASWNANKTSGLGIALLFSTTVAERPTSGFEAMAAKWSEADDERGWRLGYDSTTKKFRFDVSSDGINTSSVQADLPPDLGYWETIFAWQGEDEIGIQIGDRPPVTATWANNLYDAQAPFAIGGIKGNAPAGGSNYFTGSIDECLFTNTMLLDSVRTWLYNRTRFRTNAEIEAIETLLGSSDSYANPYYAEHLQSIYGSAIPDGNGTWTLRATMTVHDAEWRLEFAGQIDPIPFTNYGAITKCTIVAYGMPAGSYPIVAHSGGGTFITFATLEVSMEGGEDTGFDRIEQIQDKTVAWGRTQS